MDTPQAQPKQPKQISPAKTLLTLDVEFKDGTILHVDPKQEPTFEIMPTGFFFITYRPIITADAKEQLDITFVKRWYRLDEITYIHESRTERYTDAADIREFKLQKHKALKNVPNVAAGDQIDPTPERTLK